MLQYPFSLPHSAWYAGLGIDPDAAADEITEAKLRTINGLKASQAAIAKALQEVYKGIPGLQELGSRVKELSANPDADPAELAAAQKELASLQKRAHAIRADFVQLQSTEAELEGQIHSINSMALDNPQSRAEHNAKHPPLELLELAPCGYSGGCEISISHLRRDVSWFLEQRETKVYYPSDEWRRTFESDFTFNPLLDEGTS
jgi:hypothetical protein